MMRRADSAASIGAPKHKAGALALAGLIVSAGIAMCPCAALAQNLVQNPNFTDQTGSPSTQFYQTMGQVSALMSPQGRNAAYVYGPGASQGNIVSAINQTITTTPGVVYTISFLANFDPQTTDSVGVSFGVTGISLNPPQPVDNTFDPFSFTATATSTQSILSFQANSGAFGVTGLDVEIGAAPAPIPGGGVVSLGLVLAGLAVRRMRNGATATG